MPQMIDFYDPRIMRAAITKLFPASTFLRDRFFPQRDSVFAENIDVDFRRGGRQMAPFIHPLEGGKTVQRQGFVTKNYKPPCIAPQRVLSAQDLVKRLQGEPLYSNEAPAQRAMTLIERDMLELDLMIARREEWMCSQVLYTGALTMNATDAITGQTFSEVVNYTLPNVVTLAGAATWDSAGSDPLFDLDHWKIQVAKVSGVNCDTCIMASDVFQFFIANQDIREIFFPQRLHVGDIEPNAINNSTSAIGTLRKPQLEIFSYDEWYTDDSGVTQPMVPLGTVLLGSSKTLNSITYGAVTQLIGDTTDHHWESNNGPRIPRLLADVKNNVQLIRMSSRPLPIPEDILGWAVLNVLSPTALALS